jgi:hypothetical protein
MKWSLVNNPLHHTLEFRLTDTGDTIAVLKYSLAHHSVRITFGQGRHHRLFYIEKTKQPFSKSLLKDQYGMHTGTVIQDKIHDNSGSLALDNNKYFYRVETKDEKQLIIYESNPLRPLYRCDIPIGSDNSAMSFLAPALCWCCQLAHAEKRPVGHAA